MIAHGDTPVFPYMAYYTESLPDGGSQRPMANKSERLSVLSDAEQEALYGLPDFDDRQQLNYLSLSETELALASSRPGLHAQVYCALQIGYFKAKHAFFRFDWDDAQEDCAFVLSRYFRRELFRAVKPSPITNTTPSAT